MQFRLWHILALMGLILLAGVLSVQQVEADVGRTTVPGVVIIDVPGMDESEAGAVVRRWPGSGLQWVPADGAPLSPFDPARVRNLRARGQVTAWVRAASPDVSPGADPDAALHEAWGVLVSGLPTDEAAGKLGDFVASCDGVRPFVVGLQLPSPTLAQLLVAVARQVDAAEKLPGFRRTTIVVLGERDPDEQRRIVVRLDRGDIDRIAPPALKDLLADPP